MSAREPETDHATRQLLTYLGPDSKRGGRYRRWLGRSLGMGWRHLLIQTLRNVLTGIGGLCLLAVGFFYLEGKYAARDFEPRFMDVAAEFARRVLREDVPAALVTRLRAAPGLDRERVIAAMRERAEELGIMLVQNHPVSEVLNQMDLPGENPATRPAPFPYMEIFEFCDMEVAGRLLAHDPNYLVHIPCRIGLYQDATGQLWLISMNLDLLIHGSRDMPAKIKNRALAVQDGLLKIMAAGAEGLAGEP